MSNRRVVVTGIGLVSPVGIGTETNWRALTTGQCGIGPITRFDASAFAARIAGEVGYRDPASFSRLFRHHDLVRFEGEEGPPA